MPTIENRRCRVKTVGSGSVNLCRLGRKRRSHTRKNGARLEKFREGVAFAPSCLS
jgi:hypothetical protein